MRFTAANRFGFLALGVLLLIGLFDVFDLRAGEELADTDTLANNPPLNVAESNKDANGNIKVHDQGVVSVTGTVNVGNNPSVQDVRVTNNPLQVAGNFNVGQGTVRILDEELHPFEKDTQFDVDISMFDKVRLRVIVNGSGTVDFFYVTDGGYRGDFSVDSGDDHTVFLGDVPGTAMAIHVTDPDGEQVFVKVFGSN